MTNSVRPLIRLLAFLRPHWYLTAGSFACVAANTALTLVVPALLGIAVDEGVVKGDLSVLARVSMLILGASALRGAFAFGQGYLAESAAQGVSYALRRELYAHVQRLSFSFHDQSQTGELMARATADVEQVRNFTGRGLVHSLQLGLLLVGVSIALLGIEWPLALLSLTVLPALAWRTHQLGRRIRPMYRVVQNEVARLAALAQENVAGVRVVKSFGREVDEIKRFEEQNERLFRSYVVAARETALNIPLLDLVANVSTLVLLWLSGVLVIQGHLTFGELVAFYSYLLQLMAPVRRGGWLMSMSSRASASAERIFEILDTPVTVAERPEATELPAIRGAVELRDVSCAYRPGRPVLKAVTFRAEPGETIALVGATASGKTSIANLIPRFYDVSGGSVLVDGFDVRDVGLQSLRRQVGVVFQETLLFSGTIRENIAFGRPDVSDEEVRTVARAARAEEFIEHLPLGYETLVGERGASLSGGQKQRIAIARALLMDPRILILDEFTSNVDLETERLIRAALAEVMRDRTTFVIAHRLSTVRAADRILVMEGGRLVAQGKHDRLLTTSKEYSEIYAAQLESEDSGVLASDDGARPTRFVEGVRS